MSEYSTIQELMGSMLENVRCRQVPNIPKKLHAHHVNSIAEKLAEWRGEKGEISHVQLIDITHNCMLLAVEEDPGVTLKIAFKRCPNHQPMGRYGGQIGCQGFGDIPYRFELVINEALEAKSEQDWHNVEILTRQECDKRGLCFSSKALGRKCLVEQSSPTTSPTVLSS